MAEPPEAAPAPSALRMQGKAVLVTGAGAAAAKLGIGRACALLYARHGARVLAVDINLEAARETVELIRAAGGEAEAVAADVSAETSVGPMTAACMEHFGRLDVLHNNVGILSAGGPVELPLEDWTRTLAVNQTSLFLTCKHAIPRMLEGGGGAIVNVSSIAGLRWLGVPHSAYATTKGAILAFTRNLALEYAGQGIRANCVVPGLLDTPMIRAPLEKLSVEESGKILAERDAAVPLGTMGSPWDVAFASLFLASEEARYITGTELVVDGGLIQSAMRAPALGG